MDKRLIKLYRRFRQANPFMLVGHNADQALRAAKTILRWERLESAGLVRLEAKPDDNFDWTDNDWTQEEISRYSADGAWGSVGEFSLGLGEWGHGGSVWGHVGYKDVLSPYENPYIIDIMGETIDALRAAIRARCQCCKGTGERATA